MGAQLASPQLQRPESQTWLSPRHPTGSQGRSSGLDAQVQMRSAHPSPRLKKLPAIIRSVPEV